MGEGFVVVVAITEEFTVPMIYVESMKFFILLVCSLLY